MQINKHVGMVNYPHILQVHLAPVLYPRGHFQLFYTGAHVRVFVDHQILSHSFDEPLILSLKMFLSTSVNKLGELLRAVSRCPLVYTGAIHSSS